MVRDSSFIVLNLQKKYKWLYMFSFDDICPIEYLLYIIHKAIVKINNTDLIIHKV